MTTSTHYPIMGTVVQITLHIDGSIDGPMAEDIDTAIVEELNSLETTFSAFNPESELSTWRIGQVTVPSNHLETVLAATLRYQLSSGGRFNPLAGEICQVWAEAARSGEPPDRGELERLARGIEVPRYALAPARPTADCSRLNLNAIAKGYCVDAAAQFALQTFANLEAIVINAGGDLLDRRRTPDSDHERAPIPTDDSPIFGVENPHRPYDNEPPLCQIRIHNQALATSGQARRGIRIGSEWYGHCLDPRTGQPVSKIASVTVIAPTAMDADALATIFTLTEPEAAIALADAAPGVGVFIVDNDRQQHANGYWSDRIER